MKRSIKKIGIVACAALFIGAGISGIALAANDVVKDAKRAERMEQTPPLMPPMMRKLMKDLEITDAQKAQLEALREKQKALRDEFWAVFTEEQKTAMLERMMQRRHKDMHGKPHHDGPRKGMKGDGERGRWRDGPESDGPREDAESPQ